LMGRRTLPDDKIVNALSIARYDSIPTILI
jgi:hypothetical protein